MADIVIAIVVAFALACVAGIAFEIIDGNDALQKDYNRSIVECVEAGAGPLECRTALSGQTR